MASTRKHDLVKQVTLEAQSYVNSTLLFRHVVGEVLGLNAADMACLGFVFFKGSATPSELSLHTGLSSGATTAMLDRLEKAKLIERRPNPNDRRSVRIFIVREKAEQAASLYAAVREAQDKLVSSYSERELEFLSDFFKRSSALWEEQRNKLKQSLERGLR